MGRKKQSISELIGYWNSISPVSFDLIGYDDDKKTILVHFHGDDFVLNGTVTPVKRELTWNYFRMMMNKKVNPTWFVNLIKKGE